VRENQGIGIIRVNFVNEFLKRNLYNGLKNEKLTEPISKIIKEGIKILDVEYKCFNYSNSQLKQHSCWFITGDPKIIEQYGDF
jgi:hypothetical protein